MDLEKQMKFATKTVHAGVTPEPVTGAIMTPVFLTSTYAQEELGKHKGYEYSRVSNPTRTVLEQSIAELEGGSEGMAFGSGTAAVDAIFHLLKPGDHVLLSRDVYGGTFRIARQVWEAYGLEFEFIDTTRLEVVDQSFRPNTRMLFIETPTNPTMQVTDLAGASAIARRHGVISVVDNTFATPYIQRPLEHGYTLVVHSLTKYLNGHSDMLGGFVVTNDRELAGKLRFLQKAVGAILSPFDSWLCLRGVKTLSVRMRQHCDSAMKIAQWLTTRKEIGKVHFPGLPSHPQHGIACRQMNGFGGMISFDLGSLEKASAFLKNVRLCALAESLGGVETLISHPATMTHASIPPDIRRSMGIGDGLVRISVGIEDPEDIMEDIEGALKKIN